MVTSRTVNNIIGKVLVMVARSRVFMYPVIYMSQYDVVKNALMGTHTHTHTHPFNGPLSGATLVSRYQKGKTSLDFTEARDSEWQ